MKHSHWLMQESLQLLSCGLLDKITPPSRPIRSNNNNVLPADVFPRLAQVAPLGLLHDWLFSLLTFAVIGQRISLLLCFLFSSAWQRTKMDHANDHHKRIQFYQTLGPKRYPKRRNNTSICITELSRLRFPPRQKVSDGFLLLRAGTRSIQRMLQNGHVTKLVLFSCLNSQGSLSPKLFDCVKHLAFANVRQTINIHINRAKRARTTDPGTAVDNYWGPLGMSRPLRPQGLHSIRLGLTDKTNNMKTRFRRGGYTKIRPRSHLKMPYSACFSRLRENGDKFG